jgi:hypothetical protein
LWLPQTLETARKPPQKLGGLLFARWSFFQVGAVAELWAFILWHLSSAAQTGGVNSNCCGGAQSLVFDAGTVDAFTVSARNKN